MILFNTNFAVRNLKYVGKLQLSSPNFFNPRRRCQLPPLLTMNIITMWLIPWKHDHGA